MATSIDVAADSVAEYISVNIKVLSRLVPVVTGFRDHRGQLPSISELHSLIEHVADSLEVG
jgi:hypothetical protein